MSESWIKKTTILIKREIVHILRDNLVRKGCVETVIWTNGARRRWGSGDVQILIGKTKILLGVVHTEVTLDWVFLETVINCNRRNDFQ